MKKVLFWVLHRPDRSPSQRFRFEQYLSYLKENGYDYDYSYLINKEDDKVFYGSGNYLKKLKILLKSIWKRYTELSKAKRYDLVFIQRECFMLGTAWFEKRMAKKTKMIFDFDDAIWLHAISDGNKALAFLKDASKTERIIKAAHLVFAGNDYLADYARKFNPNVVIIPTTVNTDLFVRHPQPQRAAICIGWSGSFSTIPHFESCLESLRIIKAKYGDKVYFKVIGDGNYKNEELNIKGIPWTAEDEVSQLSELEIGLMPLPDDIWTRGKCGLKGLCYMSLGVATIMSPVGVNTQIIQDGVNGFLASTVEEWVDKISLLVDDVKLRKKLGTAGRQTVLDNYSAHSQKKNYLKYFNELCLKV
jgi:glycosyltransferase involved in cell wall biosynthesis